jgi:hypothetical protein
MDSKDKLIEEDISIIKTEFAVKRFNQLFQINDVVNEEILISILMFVYDNLKEKKFKIRYISYKFYIEYIYEKDPIDGDPLYDNYLIGIKTINKIKSFHCIDNESFIFLFKKFIDIIIYNIDDAQGKIFETEEIDNCNLDDLKSIVQKNKDIFKVELEKFINNK